MTDSFTRRLQLFYFCSLFLILTFQAYLVSDSIKKNIFSNDVSKFSKSIKVVDDLERVRPIQKIFSAVNNGRSEETIIYTNLLENDFLKLLRNNEKNKKELKNLEDKLTKTLFSIQKINSMPSLSRITNVLLRKVKKFNTFVKKNTWPTLIRISSRLSTKLEKFERDEVVDLKSQVRLMFQDVSIMRNITQTSSLSRSEKSKVLIRLESMKVELNMINEYVLYLIETNKNIKTFEKIYENWLRINVPKIVVKKIDKEEQVKKWYMLFMGSLALTVVSIFAGLVFYFSDKKRISRYFKKIIIDLSKKLASSNEEEEFFYDKDVNFKIKRYKDYINKRLEIGQVLQEFMPFPSLILNENLSLEWCNSLFMNVFNIDAQQLSEKILTWDYLHRYTNLGNNDPIMSSLEEDYSSLSQVSINLKDKVGHYDLYINPLKINNKKYIFLLLYPLETVNHTISAQRKSVINPINELLKSLISESGNGVSAKQFENDFKNAGISDLYYKILEFSDIGKKQKESLLLEIDRLEEEKADIYKLQQDVKKFLSCFQKFYVDMQKDIDESRDVILDLSGESETHSSLGSEVLKKCQKVYMLLSTFKKDFIELSKKHKDTFSYWETINENRRGHKKYTHDLAHASLRISNSLEQISIFFDDNDEKYNELKNRIRDELELLNKSIMGLEKYLITLDVILSKGDMLISNDEEIFKKLFDSFSSIRF